MYVCIYVYNTHINIRFGNPRILHYTVDLSDKLSLTSCSEICLEISYDSINMQFRSFLFATLDSILMDGE